ncbi:MAG: hydrogenase [Deltaproteobacteria bacterium]|nr:hydrogenase [Deltaproteobacteria bacterium]
MSHLFDPLLVSVLLLNLFVLGASRLRSVIGASALQGVALGLLTVAAHDHITFTVTLVALIAIGLKGVLIPKLLYKAMRDVAIVRDVEPLIGLIPSLAIGAVGTGASVIFARTLPVADSYHASLALVLPSSFATVLTGCLVLVTRRKAITQVVGYLILENGIFIMGLGLIGATTFLVEIGVLLDLFVAIFVMGIIINHVRREFETTDAAELSSLKE